MLFERTVFNTYPLQMIWPFINIFFLADFTTLKSYLKVLKIPGSLYLFKYIYKSSFKYRYDIL